MGRQRFTHLFGARTIAARISGSGEAVSSGADHNSPRQGDSSKVQFLASLTCRLNMVGDKLS